MQNVDLNNAAKVLQESGQMAALTSGRSMRPMLKEHRDVVVIEQVKNGLEKGDVVLYSNGQGGFILHRIVKIKKEALVIRGDNNYFTEYNVKTSDIVGVLKEFYREGKYIDCATDKGYRLYTFYILHSYCLRYVWVKFCIPPLVKVKHLIFGKPKSPKNN